MSARFRITWLAAASTIFLLADVTEAQVTTATFYGIVTDTSGAAIPAASVTLAHEGTATITARTTDSAGEFVFDFLRAGAYTLRIEASGFKSYESKQNQFEAAQNIRRTFVLEVGAVTETVIVEASATLVNTVSTEQRQSFSRQEVTELPLARRNFSNVLSIGTGITTSASGGVRMNGVGRSGLKVTVDGTNATSNSESPGTSMYQSPNYIDTLSIEAVQEVQTVKGVIPAEYGEQLAGTVNVISKSGTNQWHGSLFENSQNDALNARNQFLVAKAPLTFNQFGGSLGGPIRRDRIFVFGVYEGYREEGSLPVSGDVPTPQLRAQMAAAVPQFELFLKTLPLPNQPFNATAAGGRYIGVGAESAHDNDAVAKGDILLTNASSLALTYTRTRPFNTQPRVSPVNPQTWIGLQERGTANFIASRAHWTSETRFGYNFNDLTRFDGYWNLATDPAHPETEYGGRRVPSLQVPGFDNGGGGKYISFFGPVWSIEEKYARHAGQHSFKFGGIYEFHGAGRTNIAAPNIVYANVPDLLANVPSQIAFKFGSNRFNSHNWALGVFIQDDWRVSSKLVINFGARYNYFSHFVATPANPAAPAGLFNFNGLLDNQFHFGPFRDPLEPVNSVGCGSLCNIGPRAGFSYNPDGHGRTVVRGGFSVMFAPQPLDDYDSGVGTSTKLPLDVSYSRVEVAARGLKFPVFNQDAKTIVQSGSQIVIGSVFDPNIQNPYTMNLYLGLERELTSSTMIESAFVGNRGVKFRLLRNYNNVNRATGIRPNPDLGQGMYFSSDQDTVYYSWQTSLRKRYSRNLTCGVHYTWGKALSYSGGDTGSGFSGDTISTIQDFFNRRANRGPSTGDATHRLSAEYVYDLPRATGMSSAVRRVAGGWQMSGVFTAATGEPLLITQSSSAFASRPDYIGGDSTLSNARQTLQYLNRAAFARVPIGSASNSTLRPGNIGNGAVRGLSRWNMDFSVGKNVPLTERFKLQIRGDMFNVFNHTNFSGVTTEITSGNFGRFTSTTGARIIQMNARLSW